MLSLVVYFLVDIIVKGALGQSVPSGSMYYLYNYAGLGAAALCSFIQMLLGKINGDKDTSKYLWDIVMVVAFFAIDYLCSLLGGGVVLQELMYSAFILIIFVLSAWGKISILSKMSAGVYDNLLSNPYVASLFKETMRRMSVFASVAFLCYLLAYFEIPNVDWWKVFVQDFLVFVVITLAVAVEYYVSRKYRAKYKDVEWVPLLSENGDVIGHAPRPLVHNGSCWLHPVVHLHVFDSNGRLLLQLRPAHKKIQPSKWDTAVGGHVTLNEPIDVSLKREAMEEIGLTDFIPTFAHKYIWRSSVENEYVFAFKTVSDGPFKPVIEDEVDDLRFWTIEELREELNKSDTERNITPNLAEEIKRLGLV